MDALPSQVATWLAIWGGLSEASPLASLRRPHVMAANVGLCIRGELPAATGAQLIGHWEALHFKKGSKRILTDSTPRQIPLKTSEHTPM